MCEYQAKSQRNGLILLGLLSILLPLAVEGRRQIRYRKAEPIAIRQFGDREAPLSDLEREEWYSSMGVEKGNRPDLVQLREYAEKYNPNVSYP